MNTKLKHRIYRLLKTQQAELAQRGIPFAYGRQQLTRKQGKINLTVYYQLYQAAGGGCTGVLTLRAVNTVNGQIDYQSNIDADDIKRYVDGIAYCDFITKPIGPAMREVDKIMAQLESQRRTGQ